MKNWMVLFMVAALVTSATQEASAWGKKKKKKVEDKQVVAKPETPYDKLFKGKKSETAKSKFITLHKVGKKLYFELPLVYLERRMLLASTLTSASDNDLGEIGYKSNDPLHIKFTRTDSTIYMRSVNTSATYDEKETGMQKAYERNFIDPMLKAYDILAYTNDSLAVVIDMTDFFSKHNEMLPALPKEVGGMISVSASPNNEGFALRDFKAFDDNVSIKTDMAYNVSMSIMGMFAIRSNDPVSLQVTRTLLLLPEEQMRPRISDSRVGIFLTDKINLSTEEDGLQTYSLAHRWRLEPKDMEAYKRGELVEPVKPIVFYLDDAFPELWREPIKEGTMRWNKAFEKIGFKNVVQVLDFPKNDPNFDPDNLKYSCIRYVPSTTANAMGPSWVDPMTGEIINASVLVYNDVIKLINNWRFVQTAQIDPSVRDKKMPDAIVKESIAYVVAHEVGHCLGFMHNMAASAAYPVDSLRSATFTQKYGTTPSIMDYARFNYVAQPGDKGVRLTPPDLGVYDEFLIKWNYQPIPEARSVKEETAILEKWVDEKAGDPRYRYGCQQVYSRYDPSALEEDLGDDPMKAGEYGIRNLQYILKNMDQWITGDDTGEHKEALLESLMEQYFRYLQNVRYNIGGIYLNRVKEGTPGEKFQPVPKSVQKASLAWIIKQIRNSDWLNDKALNKKLDLRVSSAAVVQNVITAELLKSYTGVILSAHVAQQPYTVKEYFNDLFNGIWENTVKGRKLTNGDMIMQTAVVDMVSGVVGEKAKKSSLFGLTGSTSIDEIVAYGLDESGMVRKYRDILKNMEGENNVQQIPLDAFGQGYGWQREISVKAIDNSKTYVVAMAYRMKSLLESKLSSVDKDTRDHYRMLLLTLERALKI